MALFPSGARRTQVKRSYSRHIATFFFLAKAIVHLCMNTSVIKERVDTANIIAQTRACSLAGDAKASRLSRTAKNLKDFKAEALNQSKTTPTLLALYASILISTQAESNLRPNDTVHRGAAFTYAHQFSLSQPFAFCQELRRLMAVFSFHGRPWRFGDRVSVGSSSRAPRLSENHVSGRQEQSSDAEYHREGVARLAQRTLGSTATYRKCVNRLQAPSK